MPSRIAVFGGTTMSDMRELGTVTVPTASTSLLLLKDMRTHYRFIEISILKCRNGGIDCRIHQILVNGLTTTLFSKRAPNTLSSQSI